MVKRKQPPEEDLPSTLRAEVCVNAQRVFVRQVPAR